MNVATRCAVFLSLIALAAGAQAQQTRTCTEITSLPFRVSTPGSYCLNQSLQFTGSALLIESSDVTVDFNGNTVSAVPGSVPQAAVLGITEHRNVTIRNGTIRGGSEGISLSGSDHIIENMRIEDISGLGNGISLSGNTALVRNNFIRGVSGTGCCGVGIYAVGTGARISGNQVLEMGQGVQSAIQTAGNGVLIEGNQIANTTVAPTGSSVSYGILVGGGKATIAHNYVHNFRMGVVVSGSSGTAAVGLGNTVSGATTPFAGFVTLGGNENLSF